MYSFSENAMIVLFSICMCAGHSPGMVEVSVYYCPKGHDGEYHEDDRVKVTPLNLVFYLRRCFACGDDVGVFFRSASRLKSGISQRLTRCTPP